MAKTPISAIQATNRYVKNHCRRFTLQCNKETEGDIIEFLEAADNYNALLKRVIREEIGRRGGK